MKRTKKRNPAREPFASTISDAERESLLRLAELGEQTNADAAILWQDYNRAMDKRFAALTQIVNPDQSVLSFAMPERSASSAGATAETLHWQIDDWVTLGAKSKRSLKKANAGRHGDDQATAALHSQWEQERREILQTWNGCSGRVPTERGIAALICARVPGSNVHTVRGHFARKKRKQGQVRGSKIVD